MRTSRSNRQVEKMTRYAFVCAALGVRPQRGPGVVPEEFTRVAVPLYVSIGCDMSWLLATCGL